MLAAARDDDLRGLEGEAVLALVLVGDGGAQLGDAGRGGVFGEAGGQGLGTGVLDVLRVSKSGSPAPKPTTSRPSAFICLAFESMARVSEGVREAARFEIL